NASVHAQIDIPRPAAGADAKDILPKYKGSVDVTSGELDGLPYTGKAKIVSLQASFEEKNISLTHLSAELLGTTIAASGALKDNSLDLKASGKIGLNVLLPVIKERYGWPIKELSGDADANVRILADIAQKKTSFEGEIFLHGPAFVFGDAARPLTASGGRISFNTQEEKITWHLENIPLLERAFVLDGTWTGFKTSLCVVKATAQDMAFEARVNKMDNALDISSLKLSAKDSRLEGSGQYDLATAAFHLNAGGDINIADLKEWVPQKAVFEKPIDLNGLCHIQFDAAGPAKSWTSWKISSNITSKALHIKGFTIKDITLNYTQTAGQGLINFLNFTAYNGPATVKGRLDLNTKGPRYSLTGELKDLDLNRLKNDIPDMKNKAFYGKVSIQAVAEGTGADTKSISGQGQIVVTDGNIWEFNPLKGLGNFIFMPRFDTLAFSHATGDFMVKDGWMTTENLDLMGQDVELLVKGKIGFDGTLDLVAVTQVPTTGPGQSPIGEAVNTAGGMTAINITGSVEKPQYKLQPITQNIFKKLGDLFSSIAP
ncbi:MAG: AsmA-like C-terminal region-containing protein, partial [Candidatus Omnitrophota bacterium]